jgi:hypothetical protein
LQKPLQPLVYQVSLSLLLLFWLALTLQLSQRRLLLVTQMVMQTPMQRPTRITKLEMLTPIPVVRVLTVVVVCHQAKAYQANHCHSESFKKSKTVVLDFFIGDDSVLL